MSNPSEKIVLDLETKKGFDEVGGRNFSFLGVSALGIYSYKDDKFSVLLEKDVQQLLPYLQRAELIIGFNIKHFDYPVLQPYLDLDLSSLATLDMLEEVQKSLGFRISLNSLAQATLKLSKKGSGLDALRYFREGQLDKLAEYCQHDVFVTRQLYEYGRRRGHLLFYRGARLEAIPVSWGECATVTETLKAAFAQHLTVEIEYASATMAANNQNNQGRLRQIDIYQLELGRITAFCHLRQDLRTFNIRRVLSAKVTQDHYQIPANFKI